MSEISPSSQNLDKYLKQIENRERAKRRNKRILLIVLLLLVCGGGAFAWRYFSMLPKENQYVVAAYEELDITTVAEIFSEGNNRTLVVEFPHGLASDTIHSLDEYLQYMQSEEFISQSSIVVSPEGESEEIASTAEADEFPAQAAFYVEGSWTEDRELTFAIPNFTESFTYEMDFGNGVKREIESNLSQFTYWIPGSYTVVLTISDSTGRSVSGSRKIRISRQSVEPSTQSELAVNPRQVESVNPSGGTSTTREDENEADTESGASQTTTDDVADASNARRLDPVSPLKKIDSESKGQDALSGSEKLSPTAMRSPEVSKPSVPVGSKPGTKASEKEQASPPASASPKFPGGNVSLAKYIRNNMKYPESAVRKGVEGRVIVRFIVKENGEISNPQVVKGIGSGCDEEAVRLVQNMPNWIPGEQMGQKIPVYYQLAIKFQIF